MAREQHVDDMTVWEHIGELRKRIVYILIVLLLGMIIGFIVTDPIYNYLIHVAPVKNMSFHAFSNWDAIGIYMKFAFVIGLVVGLPFTMYQLWLFVKPGLREIEQKGVVQYIPFVLILFLVGVAFAYYVVFPLAFHFTSRMSQRMGLIETYGVTQYFGFLFHIIIPISLLFELPIIIMFLTKIRIVNPSRLRKMRRFAYFGLIFVGVLITPPDFISDALVAIPLILLYEFSVWLSQGVYRKQLAREQAWEEEFERDEPLSERA